MKKQLILGMSLLAAMSLVSCGEKATSSLSSDSSLSSESSSEAAKDWTTSQKAIMTSHLHGVALPFPGGDNYRVAYDEDTTQVVVDGGPDFTLANLTALAASFVDEGWQGGDISAINNLPEGTVYQFEKSVETDDGTRYVRSQFFLENAEDDAFAVPEGTLYMFAADPYVYEWPAELIDFLAMIYSGGSENYSSIPVVEASHYEVSFGYIYAYVGSFDNDDAGYSEILTNNQWTVLDEKDDDGYYVAISPEENYKIAYLYSSEYGSLDIYFEQYEKPIIYDHWDVEEIEKFFAYHDEFSYEIPALEIEGASYHYYEAMEEDDWWSIKGGIDIYPATQADYDGYLTTLTGNGWDLTEKEELGIVTASKDDNHKLHTIDVSFDGSDTITICYYYESETLPYETWPSDVIASSIADIETLDEGEEATVLPEYAGEYDGIYVNGNVIDIVVGEDNVLAAIEDYGQTLTDNGWTAGEEDGQFVSPNGKVMCVPTQTDNPAYLELYLTTPPVPETRYDTFPTSYLEEEFEGHVASAIPAFDGATYYTAGVSASEDGDDLYGWVNCVFEGEGYSAAALLTQYEGILAQNGYEFDEGIEKYVSSDGNMAISIDAEDYEALDDEHEPYAIVGIYFDNIVDGIL